MRCTDTKRDIPVAGLMDVPRLVVYGIEVMDGEFFIVLLQVRWWRLRALQRERHGKNRRVSYSKMPRCRDAKMPRCQALKTFLVINLSAKRLSGVGPEFIGSLVSPKSTATQ